MTKKGINLNSSQRVIVEAIVDAHMEGKFVVIQTARRSGHNLIRTVAISQIKIKTKNKEQK